jgi:hypothetical protein
MERYLTLDASHTVLRRHMRPDPFKVLNDLDSSMRSLERLARENPLLARVLLTLHGQVDHARECINFLVDSKWVS